MSVLLLLAVLVFVPGGEAAHGGDRSIVWKNWSFTYSTTSVAPDGHEGDGVVLKVVTYKGIRWFDFAHLVGIKVTYEGSPCSLFYDELVHESMVTDTHDGQTIPAFEAREIDVDTYRIMSHFHFGWYHYTQVWTFKNGGPNVGSLYSELYIHPTSSNSCIDQFRTYEPRWRFDYCLNGCGNERVELFLYDEFVWIPISTEDIVETGTSGSHWNIRVRDVGVPPAVYMKGLYKSEFEGGGRYVVLLYRSTEVEPSHDLYNPPPYPAIWDNNENVNPAHVVVWYTDSIRQRGTDPTAKSGTHSGCYTFEC